MRLQTNYFQNIFKIKLSSVFNKFSYHLTKYIPANNYKNYLYCLSVFQYLGLQFCCLIILLHKSQSLKLLYSSPLSVQSSEIMTNNNKQYLNRLLNKHQKSGSLTESFVKEAEKHYEQDIKTGKYQIRESQFLAKPMNKSQAITKAQKQKMKKQKYNLEKNLEIIDSRVKQLTEPELKKSKAIDDNQRRKFVTQMAKTRRQQQKKRQKQIQENLEKDRLLAQKMKEENRIKQENLRKQRKEESMKRVESLELCRKNKEIQNQKQNKILKQKMHEKILSERMLERYRENQTEGLEQKKKRLAEIRSLHKPLTKDQFQAHLQKIDQLKTSRTRAKPLTSRINGSDTQKFYKSSWYKKTTKQPKEFLDEKQQEQLQHVKQMKDKLKKYAQYVRHNFKPEVDKKKIMDKATSRNKSVPMPKTEDLRQLGLKYLQYSKQQIDQNKRQRQNQQKDDPKIRNKPKNYLQQLKKNHPSKVRSASQVVEAIKVQKNISEAQKAQKIMDYIQGIQRKAKMREQKSKLSKDTVDPQLDNLYMDAIAVKLSMLGKD